ncbi:hypothetical protein F5876DRAFT_35178 [Lentinula aff. lateritia]|uniref:Uncharacterized protein n=1 Tax=Lentinula aff. lateritia TaxID=2804960 RepID=A0ACC1U8S8_9AGAR|nr:hypothetical protein F5876DRAFT_35178 [Lentinula aff. lateritia]
MGPSGSRHVTMDDLEDERRIREEDEEKRNEGDEESEEDDEEEEEEEEERDRSIDHGNGQDVENDDDGEDEDEDVDVDEDEDDDDDDDQSPRSSFQARLEHLRKRASSETGATSAKSKGKAKAKASLYDDSDSEDEDDWDRNRTWAEADDDFIAQPQDILDENEDILVGREKKSKKQVFQAVYNGDFEDVDMGKPAPKDKHKDIPPDLVDLWNKDRAKKAIRKQERELARLAATADPLTKKRGGKKGRKAMLAAAKLDPTIVVLPNRVIDMTTLVQQIRRFIDDIGGPSTMSLPPANNQTRKNIHELAAALNLKSFSKGSGDARYTTLAKTTMSGIRVNQKKVAKIVRRGGGLADNAEFVGGADMWKKHAERGKASKSTPKHREGDEVGKAAPKINETNIGFKMLASMGWTEGDPIGQSGGLQNPLTAVIKNTKLGLGAMK